MPNILDENGLQVMSQAELIAYYTGVYQTAYGMGVILTSNSPDGQAMMGQVQAALDNLDLQVQIYNSMNPDNAIGVTLDQRVAYNGIKRKNGTFTIQNLLVTVNQALTLPGLDQTVLPAFTYTDPSGNQWQLITSQSPVVAGAFSYAFQALNPGAIFSQLNTITIPVTVILGVTSVNNPTTYTTLGLNEETDATLRLRRQRAVSIASNGFNAALTAALENINGVISANVYENDDSVTDVDGVPGHTIWIVIDGNPADSDVANVIYRYRNGGCGMFGAKTFQVARPNGTFFTVKWDAVIQENLYIEFTATSINGVNPPNTVAILAQLPTLFVPGVNQTVNINDLATLVQQIDPNTLVTLAGLSVAALGPFTPTLSPSLPNQQFVVQSGNITIL